VLRHEVQKNPVQVARDEVEKKPVQVAPKRKKVQQKKPQPRNLPAAVAEAKLIVRSHY